MPIELSRHVGVRFKPDDHRRLERQAKALGLSLSSLIRAAALGIPPARPRRALADRGLMNQLSRVGNNLNQQTRVLHQLKHRGLMPDAAPVLDALADTRRVLRELKRRVVEASP